ncbi:bifunctional diguanylate cyclase/phosphodiesterase [Fulvimarina sp. MAC8]|uniref:putative bifunctional diguanylate cyclase/phosphodiesterase n=1 Tax=Fulvimarina sp. MAC8 TaxID=3162874 RepID=UPI0032EE86DD
MTFTSNIVRRIDRIILTFLLLFAAQCAFVLTYPSHALRNTIEQAGLIALNLVLFGMLFGMRRLVSLLNDHIKKSVREQSRSYQIDCTTGVFTRSAFIESCDAELKTARKDLGFLLHFDLDNLKVINDTRGHGAGDFALRQLTKSARAVDSRAIIGRLGGDEFAMLVMNRPASEAKWVAEEVKKQLGHPVRFEGNTLELTTSIGITSITDETKKIEELLHQTDLALYASKNAGRARASFFDPSMLSETKRIRLVERELRAAILLNELMLEYQPVFDRDDRMVGCEALVRWQHSVRGRIMPSEFIEIAERSRLIDKLGEWVLRRACSDMVKFPGLRVGVNISAGQIKRDEIISTVEAVLHETGLEPQRLVLEITESMGLDQILEARARIEQLLKLGVRVSLDDFGAGHSGFSYLQSFPVCSIKIDRAFIAKLGESKASTNLVGALVNLAHACQIDVVAEGIETSEQLNLSKQAGANFFQGYHLSRPISLGALTKLVSEQSTAHCCVEDSEQSLQRVA